MTTKQRLTLEHIRVSDIRNGDTVIINERLYHVDEIDDNTMYDEYVYICDNEQWDYILVNTNDQVMRIS